MDSLTQVALGAAVGEAVLGRRAGNRAALAGGITGTVPDLDMLANPLLTVTQEIAFHRGITHSFLFCALAAPAIGWLAARAQPAVEAGWRDWSRLAFWVLLTHVLLDCFTVYGTQVFQPFSDHAVALDAIFIVDPLYTVPLAAGLVLALRARSGSARLRANRWGIGLSTLYLLLTLANKAQVEAVVRPALAAQDLAHARLLTMPTALNNLLWIAIADDGDALWVGHYSLLDDGEEVRFERHEKNEEWLAGLQDDPPVARLLWFTRGFFRVTRDESGALVVHDYHLPRTDGWLSDRGSAIFSFRLVRDPAAPGRIAGLQRSPREVAFEDGFWLRFLYRVFGNA